jgi:hypothetical protein
VVTRQRPRPICMRYRALIRRTGGGAGTPAAHRLTERWWIRK